MQYHPIRLFCQLALALILVGSPGARSVGQDSPKSDKEAQAAKIEKLIEQLGDNSFRVREAAAKELIALGRAAVPALEGALDSRDREIQARARMILDEIRGSLAYLLDEIKNGNAEAKKAAADLIAAKGEEAKKALPDLIEMTKDKNEEVSQAAVWASYAIDPNNKAIANLVSAKATVNGKYKKLLRRLHIPDDRQSYGDFTDYGHYPATDWKGYTNIPEGYWVYVYPNWYIWGEMKPGK